MKLFSLAAGALALLLTGCRSVSAEPPTTNQPAPRLTVELRDGSRVIGQSADDSLEFDSALLGSLKLKVEDLRSIVCETTNSARLTTTNGDTLAGWFVSPNLRMNTEFGRVELPVKSVRRVQFSSINGAGQLPAGLVALWSGEDNSDDVVNGNHAVWTDVAYTEGKVARAFLLNGTSSLARVTVNPILDVGTGEGLTVTAWIDPNDVSGFHPIMEWNQGGPTIGVQFWIGHRPEDHGVLQAYVVGTDGQPHSLTSQPGTVVVNCFQFVSFTYDKKSGQGFLYLNGTVVAHAQWGSFTPLTKGDIWISQQPSNPGDWTYNRYFSGVLDELAIYNRALSAAEIQAVGTGENHGEALPPPARPPGDGRWNTNF